MPSFFSKLVKAPPSLSGSHKRRSHSRSGSTSSVNSSSHARKQSQPSISVSAPTVDPPRLSNDSAALSNKNSITIPVPSGYERFSSSNSTFHVIPPSPHSSNISFPEVSKCIRMGNLDYKQVKHQDSKAYPMVAVDGQRARRERFLSIGRQVGGEILKL